MDASPNVSFGENSYRDIAVNSSEDRDQDDQNTAAPSVATMGAASIRDDQLSQSAISLMQASIQSTLETSFTAMSTQLDKVSNIVMQTAQDAQKQREEDRKERVEERKFQQQQMDKQIEATWKAREADWEFFRNLMQMRIEHTTQQPTINTLSPTPQLIHQSQ